MQKEYSWIILLAKDKKGKHESEIIFSFIAIRKKYLRHFVGTGHAGSKGCMWELAADAWEDAVSVCDFVAVMGAVAGAVWHVETSVQMAQAMCRMLLAL